MSEEKKNEAQNDSANSKTKDTKQQATSTGKVEKKDKKSKKTAKEVETLKTQIGELNDKVDAITDQYIRSKAEIANIQKRNEKEQANLVKYDGQNLAKDILPVIDNLERALSIEVTDENGKQLKKGIQMVYDLMTKALKDNHVTEIESVGKPFDPHIQQAVQTVPAEKGQKADQVVRVLQKGYMLKDRVLRPAMVVVTQ
ncbi:nucleotide exchange factor GrpE [Pediococcus cellicola]|uniref:Protein GrpE n=1 Tax=Pediococcus cellicola TaxID=319652 RepID=A0A0R2IX33_9LACO|nr:nucleotide exchange factor GrpE [Pediococcus cellicola]KRN67541.1 chaperone GrpE [Pediococcus cellicola]GEL14471.1 protein GrpE [Pediococcus cellicola]